MKQNQNIGVLFSPLERGLRGVLSLFFHILLCTGLLLCISCTSKREKTILQKAMEVVDSNPQKALLFLDSISSPELLNEKDRMCYITLLTQAKYMDYQDITTDDQILSAQQYFARHNDPEMACRANYYTASYWYEKGEYKEKEPEYQLLANKYAKKAGNQLFQMKSAIWIGSIYYDRDMLDNARIYYHQAEKLLNIEGYSEKDRLDVVLMLGRIYNELNERERASEYFDEGYEKALLLKNDIYESLFLHNKGIILRDRQQYDEAKAFFDRALSKRPASEDSIRIYLSYATLYRVTNQPDSNKYYVDWVKNRIDEITYSYTREWAFREFELEFEQRLKNKDLLRAVYNAKKSF